MAGPDDTQYEEDDVPSAPSGTPTVPSRGSRYTVADPSGPLSGALSRYYKSGRDEQAILDEAIKNLLTRREERDALPLLAMASGFLQPTRAGSFAESAGAGLQQAIGPLQAEKARRDALTQHALQYRLLRSKIDQEMAKTALTVAQKMPMFSAPMTGDETPSPTGGQPGKVSSLFDAPEQYKPIVMAASQKHGTPPELINVTNWNESRWNPKAWAPNDQGPGKGGGGLGGWGKDIAEARGFDVFDPKASIEHTAQVMKEYATKYGGNWMLARLAYGWGSGNVDKWLAAGADPNKIPEGAKTWLPRTAFGIEDEKAARAAFPKVAGMLRPGPIQMPWASVQQASLPTSDTGAGDEKPPPGGPQVAQAIPGAPPQYDQGAKPPAGSGWRQKLNPDGSEYIKNGLRYWYRPAPNGGFEVQSQPIKPPTDTTGAGDTKTVVVQDPNDGKWYHVTVKGGRKVGLAPPPATSEEGKPETKEVDITPDEDLSKRFNLPRTPGRYSITRDRSGAIINAERLGDIVTTDQKKGVEPPPKWGTQEHRDNAAGLGVPMQTIDPYARMSPKTSEQAKLNDRNKAEKMLNERTKEMQAWEKAQQDVDRFIELNKDVPTGGMGLESLGTRAAVSLGVSGEKSSEMNRISNKLARAVRTEVEDKGAVSDYDARMFKQSTLGLDVPYETNVQVGKAIKTFNQQKIDKTAFYEAYLGAHGNLSEAEQAWRRYMAANPIFDPKQPGKYVLNPNRQNWDEYFRASGPGGRQIVPFKKD